MILIKKLKKYIFITEIIRKYIKSYKNIIFLHSNKKIIFLISYRTNDLS